MDWKGLLNWSLKYQDGTVDKKIKPMSEEDQKFLEAALESVCVNEMKEIMKILNLLKEPEKDSEEEIEKRCELLEALLMFLDGPENARNLVRAKRFSEIVNYFFTTKHKQIKLILARILTSMMQNDKYVQAAAMDLGIFKILELVNNTEDKELNSKYVYMLTGLIYGESDKSKRVFLENFDGMKLLYNLIIKTCPVNNSSTANISSFKRALGLIKELTKIEDKEAENYETRFLAITKMKEINIHKLLLDVFSEFDYNSGDNVDIVKINLDIFVQTVRLFDNLDEVFKKIQEINKKLNSSTYLSDSEIKEEKQHIIEVIQKMKVEFSKTEVQEEGSHQNDANVIIDETHPKGSMLIQLKK